MADKAKTPKLRFPGFTDDWEQRKFSDLYEKVTEKNDLSFGTDKIISVANMYYKEDSSKSDADYMRTYNVMRLGDIAFEGNKSKNYAHGRFVENTIGDGIVSHVFDVFRPIAEYDLLFWKYLINYEGVMGKIMVRCTKASTMMTNLVANDFLKESIAVPYIEEQRKIGAFLEQLDNLITLHQRKLDTIKKYKTGMLQKMFPRDGADIPEVRFPGFTDPWEQRKCKEIFDKVGSPVEVEEVEVYREIGIRSHGKGIFHKDGVTGYELGNKRVFWVEPNCFVVNIVFAWERAVAKTTENERGMIASHRFPMYKPKDGVVDLDYITKFFTTNTGKEILELASPGGAGRNRTLGQKEFANSELLLPSYDEQKKIGHFLVELDNLITLHQRNLDKLQELKKGLLQQMFI